MKRSFAIAVSLAFAFSAATAQKKAYFVDGYHGGVWGHYPDQYTTFMVDQLKAHPEWKINIELEPETWDRARVVDPNGYARFKEMIKDQNSKTGRIEYVSAAYGQSYLYNISAESIIAQFQYGMKKVREHFPEVKFTTYSSEEPCFTSALPQLLRSFGINHMSLKSPNTLWGGYVRAFGGGIVNLIGPDGTGIRTSPRYAIEELLPGSTWQTEGYTASRKFMNAAFAAGIENPVAMTLQDAGWKGGPFLGNGNRSYQPTEYTTWRNYFENVSANDKATDHKFSQEDMLTSLVWGAQVTQRIAQQVRASENKIVSTQKLAAMAKVYNNTDWPTAAFEKAWQPLLLSQHHDCWIVPYNGSRGDTWADKVVKWTGYTNKACDSIAQIATAVKSGAASANVKYVKVYNTLGVSRNEPVSVDLPAGWQGKDITVSDMQGKAVPSQLVDAKIVFNADVPSVGYSTYQLTLRKAVATTGAMVKQINGKYIIETDLYRLVVDPAKGGTIESLIAKKLEGKEFVDKANARGFNELRGDFHNNGGFKSGMDGAAEVSVVENGPLRVKVDVKGTINGTGFTQTISLAQGQPKIDIWLNIDWQSNVGIGLLTPPNTYKAEVPKKAFYDDRHKLLTLFPLNLTRQKVYKNAPFDVTESKLDNTFFDSWDSIKNNIVLNWVDVTDGNGAYGMTMLSDHTSNYTHGTDFPLGLTVQYSGVGLWGRNYRVDGPTKIHYALMPHKGKWDQSGVWTAGTQWNEPLIATVIDTKPAAADLSKSLVKVGGKGIEVTNITFDGDDMLVRLFNAEGRNVPYKVTIDRPATTASLVELNGDVKQKLAVTKEVGGKSSVTVSMPRFGFRTVRMNR
ncbi:glycosyl hydrolase [Mucilaginibacter myungsuensis]|uniref:Glycosyl hydrolase n=1 Tax=Mucilaginibacter myungsuensis TaxID=649104 RepID=A0A929L465_9SPHI|nr:glycosyl hydrolase [Mucilaginibacter myungsuensis]